MLASLFLFIVISSICHAIVSNQWTLQQRIIVPEANATYAQTPSFLVGRGFSTLITGYGGNPPGLFVHTTDDGFLKHGQVVWSQQAKLVPHGPEVTPRDNFGKSLVAHNQTVIVSAPLAIDRRGIAYVFNGTLRHWSQIQRLVALEGQPGDMFGEHMSLQGDRLLVSARGVSGNAGAVYVFERTPGGIFWSRQARLVPRDHYAGHNFGAQLDLHSDTAVIAGTYEETRATTFGRAVGSFYLFRGSGGAWSQQQKLFSVDMANFKSFLANPDVNIIKGLDLSLGYRYLGPSVAITRNYDVVVGITNLLEPKKNRESVWVYKTTPTPTRWSLQQKLFWENDSTAELFHGSRVYYDGRDNIYASVLSPNMTSMYIFKSFSSGWSLQSKLLPLLNESADSVISNKTNSRIPIDPTSFHTPRVWGGNLLISAGNEVQIRRKFSNTSCLRIWMSDHFLDGWDTAVLTVRAPDSTNDTFHPHCDQVDPFYVRYCPYQPEDEGVYIFKVFAATEARFFWEISWQVEEEATGNIYRGDFATKMHFAFNATSSSFKLVSSENLIDLDAPCYRCTQIAFRRWAQMQTIGDTAFWPLQVTGAPYYISDFEGRTVYASGKVCDGINSYQCYQRSSSGIYTLRLGGGLFGRITGFPFPNASWSGCGESGSARDQFVFKIENGECIPLQKFHYRNRCDRPPMLAEANSGTHLSTPGASQAPTQNVYGEPYVKGQMYARGKDYHTTNPIIGEDSAQANSGSNVITSLDGTKYDLAALLKKSATREMVAELKMLEQERTRVQEAKTNGMESTTKVESKEKTKENKKTIDPHSLPHPILNFR